MVAKSYATHVKSILNLAYPVSLGQIGIMAASLADNIMVGQIGYKYLAASAFANAVQIIFLLFGTGFTIAITPIVGHALGSRNKQAIRDAFRDGFFINTLFGILLCCLMLCLYPFLGYFGQEEEVVNLAAPYFILLAATIIPHMIFSHFKQFTEGLQRTKPAMVINIVGNTLNVVLNYLLIYGKFGFPRLELVGAGVATFIARLVLVALFFAYFAWEKKYKGMLRELSVVRLNKTMSLDIIKTGLPIGAQFSMEAASFAIGAIMAGWISSIAQAAHQIAMNLVSTTYLAASGISAAATIRISNLLGEKRYEDMRRSGFASFMVVIVFMSIMALLFVLFRFQFPGLFVDQPEVIQLAAQLLIIGAIFQLVDGVQVVGLGTQRGMKDVRFPTVLALVAYWLIGVPISYIFGLHLGFGVVGIWYGFAIGLGTASIALLYRFYSLSKPL